jgi:predicted Rossmann fold nucleotide-binding protein DprA/Smf involved in DNA uptake
MSPTPALPPDTQATLLLCGTFTQRGRAPVKPLGPGEYNALAKWLKQHDRRPQDLLQPDPPLPTEPALPDAERLRALLGRGVQMATALERWQRLGLWVIGRGEERYPERLRRALRSAAPPLLFGAGDVERLSGGGLAVVGSRNVDAEGVAFARQVAERCARDGMPVVSGGARGVDAAAVEGALLAGGVGVAVLADRLDRAATSGQLKAAIREGRLTLATPYDPESGFSTGKAMGRNRIIYGLADFALVVRFTTGSGGTWAGAVEQLRRREADRPAPTVFLRQRGNPEDGLRQLFELGAVPFPEAAWADSGPASLSAAVPAPAPAPATPAADEGAPGVDFYALALPHLLRELQRARAPKDLKAFAERSGVLKKQLDVWLKRAEAEGLVRRVKKPRGAFIAASAPGEGDLFDPARQPA